jgi:hypothetical protein
MDMGSEDEEPTSLKDEIEDPIVEKLPSYRKEIRSAEENLFRVLLSLCQDADEGRFPSIRTDRLIKKTRESTHRDALDRAKDWITILGKERRQQNRGAIYWINFLEAYPQILGGDETVLPGMEECAAQIRSWRS